MTSPNIFSSVSVKMGFLLGINLPKELTLRREVLLFSWGKIFSSRGLDPIDIIL